MKNKKLKKGIIAFVFIIFAGCGFYYILNHPLFGVTLNPLNNSTITYLPRSLEQGNNETALQATPLATPSSAINSQKPLCGGPASLQIFILGIDLHEQSDAIRLAKIDFIDSKVFVLSIPRDLWVQIPGLADKGITEGRINAAYGYGEYFNGKGGGVTKFEETLATNYGIGFDHYLVIHDSTIVGVVDAIGGVDITLDQAVDGTLQPFDGTNEYLPYFAAGKHHMDGITALKFIKIRYSDNDFYRVDRQTQLIRAIYDKLMQPGNFLMIPKIALKFLSDQSVSTDLTLLDFMKLTCLAKSVNQSNLVFQAIPSEFYSQSKTNEGGYIELPSPQLADYIHNLFNIGNK